jgi:hypothetical protein
MLYSETNNVWALQNSESSTGKILQKKEFTKLIKFNKAKAIHNNGKNRVVSPSINSNLQKKYCR